MRGNYFDGLISKYNRKGVLPDSNLLLLYFVGLYDPERIETFKRTNSRGFTVNDFKLLSKLLDCFKTIVTTPNILTEVGNLSGQLSRSSKKESYFNVFADQVRLMMEHYAESKKICALEQFNNFGLTDAGIISIAKGNYLVLTDDLPLFAYLQNVGIDAINLNHLRAVIWQN